MRVERVTREAAQRWIGQWHYIGKVGNAQVGYFGVRDDDGQPVAIILIGNPNNVHGVAGKYGLEAWNGNAEVTRVVVHPDLQAADAAARAEGGDPKNWASRSLAAVCKHLGDEGIDWVFSYADTGQGHAGTLYQAVGATYVGYSESRPGFLEDGEPLHPRTCVARYGTQAWKHEGTTECPGLDCLPGHPSRRRGDDGVCVGRLAAEQGKHLVKVPEMLSAKHCYILVTAKSKRVRRDIRHALERHVLPYPKPGEPLAVASREHIRPSRPGSRGRSPGTAPSSPRRIERVAQGIRNIARGGQATPAATPPVVAATVIERAREGTMSEPRTTDTIDLATRKVIPPVNIELVGGKLVAIIDDPSLDDCRALRAAFGGRLTIGPTLREWSKAQASA